MKNLLPKLVKSHLFMILTILLFGLVFYFWFDFKNNLIPVWADAMIPLNPYVALKYLDSWVDINNGMVVLSSYHSIILLYAFLQKIGLSLSTSFFLHVYLIHVGGALGMYYLANLVFNGFSNKKILALLSSLLYMVTPATYNMYFAYNPYAIAPLILALLIDGIKRTKGRYIYAFFIAVAFAFGGLPDPHPRATVIIGALMILYILFEFIRTREIKRIFSFVALVILFFFLVNSWFLLRYLHNFLNLTYLTSSLNVVTATYAPQFLDEGIAKVGAMLRLFHSGINVSPDKAKEYLENNFVIFANYLYPILAFAAILFIKEFNEINTKILFFLFTALFYVTFAKGPNPPFADFYKWLLINVSIFKIFRTTAYIILGAAVSYAILIPFTLNSINKFLKVKKLKIITYSAVIFFLFFNSYPFFLGYLTLVPGIIVPADRTKHGFKIPDSYYQMNKWLEKNSQLEANVLALPLTAGYEPTIWGYYGIQMFPWIINKPVIVTQYSSFGSNINTLQNIIMEEIEYGIAGSKIFVAMSGAKYIIVKNDSYDAKNMRMNSRIKNFYSPVTEIGELSLYKTDSEYFLPKIYIPEEVIVTDMDIDRFTEIRTDTNYKIRSAFLFKSQNTNKTIDGLNTQYSLNDLPIVEFKKINPTKFRITLHQVKKEFPLVFSESYHNEWKIFPGKIVENGKLRMEDGKLDDEDQATPEELRSFIDNGWISTTRSGKETKFISKNYQGTIQNNNLPKGNFYETWFKKPLISEDKHYITNSYANSWIINPQDICKTGNFCRTDQDGSYEINLILEFWPQRLYYFGLGISFLTTVLVLTFWISESIVKAIKNA